MDKGYDDMSKSELKFQEKNLELELRILIDNMKANIPLMEKVQRLWRYYLSIPLFDWIKYPCLCVQENRRMEKIINDHEKMEPSEIQNALNGNHTVIISPFLFSFPFLSSFS